MTKIQTALLRSALKALIPAAFVVAMPLTASAQYVCDGGYVSYDTCRNALSVQIMSGYCTNDTRINGYYIADGTLRYEWCCVALISVSPTDDEALQSEEEDGALQSEGGEEALKPEQEDDGVSAAAEDDEEIEPSE